MKSTKPPRSNAGLQDSHDGVAKSNTENLDLDVHREPPTSTSTTSTQPATETPIAVAHAVKDEND